MANTLKLSDFVMVDNKGKTQDDWYLVGGPSKTLPKKEPYATSKTGTPYYVTGSGPDWIRSEKTEPYIKTANGVEYGFGKNNGPYIKTLSGKPEYADGRSGEPEIQTTSGKSYVRSIRDDKYVYAEAKEGTSYTSTGNTVPYYRSMSL